VPSEICSTAPDGAGRSVTDHPYGEGVTDGRRQAQIEELAQWASSADARAAATADLRRYGLAHGHDQVADVLGDVLVKVWGRILEEPLDERDGTSVIAYARRSVANSVTDLARGRHDLSLEDLMDSGYTPNPDEFDLVDDPLIDTGETVSHVRMALHGELSGRYVQSWYVAAALVVVALSQDDLAVAADIPCPSATHGGAVRPEYWAAVAYAGQDRCFADPDTSAVRERRSQAMRRVQQTLARALAATAGDSEGVR
jgi:hypothetical protein